MKKIALLWGGTDGEKVVSGKSADFIEGVLKNMSQSYDRYEVPEELDIFLSKKHEYGIAIPMIHGGYGEDGVLCETLENEGIPHAYAESTFHRVGFDKEQAKEVVMESGISVASGVVVTPVQSSDANIQNQLGPAPWFSKPNKAGSSIGAKVIDSLADIDAEFQNAEMIIETYLQGEEYSVGVVEVEGNAITLPTMMVDLGGSVFFDYEGKYSADSGMETFPEDIDEELDKKLHAYALQFHTLFGCKTMSRTDFIVRDGEIYFLEINTIPGFAEVSIMPRAWRKMGRTNEKLISCLLA